MYFLFLTGFLRGERGSSFLFTEYQFLGRRSAKGKKKHKMVCRTLGGTEYPYVWRSGWYVCICTEFLYMFRNRVKICVNVHVPGFFWGEGFTCMPEYGNVYAIYALCLDLTMLPLPNAILTFFFRFLVHCITRSKILMTSSNVLNILR